MTTQIDTDALVVAVGDAIVVSDAGGAITLWNPAAARMFGYSEAEALGQSLDLITPERFRKRHWDGYHNTMATGVTKYGNDLLRVPAINKAGQSLSIAFTVSLLLSKDGKVSAIVAVIRAESPDLLVDVAEALLAGGVQVMEVTFTVPRAVQVLERVAGKLGDRILLGAGTVLDPETARAAFLAGAEFIVSPAVNLEVIELCRRYGKLVMPGALTPTEVLTAWQAGADIVKIFPSELTGPKYLKALHAPLPQVRLMPTGGVNLDTAADFLKAGACALGIGGSLVEPQAVASGNLKRIESLAAQFAGRTVEMDDNKARYAQATDARRLEDVLKDADIFLGLSAARVLKPEWLPRMADKPLIMALANPEP